MKVILFAVFLAFAQAKEFSVKDTSGQICLLLDVTGTLDLTATYKNETKTLSLKLDDGTVKNDSDCYNIKLALQKSGEVWFTFSNETESSQVIPQSTFIPKTVFGDAVNITLPVAASAPALETFAKNGSFLCKAELTYGFKPRTPTEDFNFTIMATTKNFQIQNSGLANGTFGGDTKECDQDFSTTETPTTPTTASTTTPEPPSGDYTCIEGNVTAIRLVGSFQLSIEYEAVVDTKGTKKNITKLIDVPKSAKATGICQSKSSTESLTISFFKDWSIEYVFASDSKANSVGDKYHVSNITIKYAYDENLPNATQPAGTTVTANYVGSDSYLKATGKGYYQCNSNVSVTVDQVTLYTSDLKYKAFNDKGNVSFSGGDVSECSADEETSSVVPIAVGASLAGLVVIVLIAYLIGRKRSRKSGYESV